MWHNPSVKKNVCAQNRTTMLCAQGNALGLYVRGFICSVQLSWSSYYPTVALAINAGEYSECENSTVKLISKFI